MGSISHDIMPLVINSLGGTDTYTCTDTLTSLTEAVASGEGGGVCGTDTHAYQLPGQKQF